MPGTFELSRGKSGQVHFNLLASNRRVVLTSEAYKRKQSALVGIASVKKNAKKRDNFEKRTAKNGKHYFVLLAYNGEIVGQSQMYAHASTAYLGFARSEQCTCREGHGSDEQLGALRIEASRRSKDRVRPQSEDLGSTTRRARRR